MTDTEKEHLKAAEAVARESVRQLNQWQALAKALSGYTNHMHSCHARSSLGACTCGLSELRKNPLLK